MHFFEASFVGVVLGVTAGACGYSLGQAQSAADVVFTAAEAACIVERVVVDAAGEPGKACNIDTARSSGVKLVASAASRRVDAGAPDARPVGD